ncbi:MAG: helix-hairpin-helix domain-containing protein, partial [Lachnospiraceae bacterium]
ISVEDRQIRTGVSENPTEEMTASKEDFNPAVEDTTEVTTGTAISYVDVCGAVNNPGVYALPTGSRVYEAIELAGGFTKEASRDSCNQAECVTDGEQIKILTMTEATIVQAEEVRSQAEAEQAEAGIVNINTAQVSQLITLPGIGNSRAEDIIAYRNANGAFQKIEDILQVTGIKEGIYLKLKDKITVS